MMARGTVQPCLGAQRGQILVLGMVLAGLALIAMSRYFYTGQVVSARVRHTHALDAASYSGALVQARALNMMAYMNRAQIGHHIAMAHLVTLASWAHLSGTEAQQLARGNPPVHLIGMMFGKEHGEAYRAASQATGFADMAKSTGELGAAYARHDRVVQNVIAELQQKLLEAVPEARYRVMQAVLAHNLHPLSGKGDGPSENIDLALHDDQWPDLVRRFAGHTLRPFLLQTSELYRFLAPRDHTARNAWVVDARCPSRRHELRRRGATKLDSSGRWQSIDTESFHALRSNRWVGCYFREYPMGWGWIPSTSLQKIDQPYVDDPPEDFSSQDFWRWVRDSTDWNISSGSSNALANSKAALQRQRWQGGGLRSYVDIRNPDEGRASFSTRLNYGGPKGQSITTRSAAETFFARPRERLDGKSEAANLFRPYWQARLATQRWGAEPLEVAP